jgi:XTP/dITP diphosphohydrolase
MKLQLVFATNNKNKLKEARAILKDKVDVVSLADIQCFDDIDETALTLEGNALIKACYIYEHYHQNCFSDDTGLEIPALNGEPGVYSARYAGEDKDSNANMQKVLDKLRDKDNRSAQFRTVIALIIDGKEYFFEGIVKGEITKEKHGNSGFGYDPIFRPEESSLTFAEMPLDEKNKISHRGRALEKLNEFLKAYSFLAYSLSDSSF